MIQWITNKNKNSDTSVTALLQPALATKSSQMYSLSLSMQTPGEYERMSLENYIWNVTEDHSCTRVAPVDT